MDKAINTFFEAFFFQVLLRESLRDFDILGTAISKKKINIIINL